MTQESNCCRFFIPVVVLTMLIVTGAAGATGAEAGIDPGIVPAFDCSPCDDGNACTTDACDTSTGRCAHVVLACDDKNPCTLDSCDGATGCVATPLPVGTACDDGQACTAGDTCDASARCAGTNEPSGLSCDDRNACTSADACNGEGACLGVPQLLGSRCDDGLACTTDDVCAQDSAGAMACRGTARTCNDGNACTEDVCNQVTGECVTRPLNCDDGSECTVDSCTSTTGCQHRSRAGEPCEDGNACTVGDYLYCLGGRLSCIVPPAGRRVCDDRNPCTYDTCDPATGCRVIPLPRDCNDRNACTTEDVCGSTGICSGTRVTCDDGNACTTDSCDSATGLCRNTPGFSCDDGKACTIDSCDPSSGCRHVVDPDAPSAPQAVCKANPDLLVPWGGKPFGVTLTLMDRCTGRSLDPTLLSPFYVSSIYTPSLGRVALPTPDAGPDCTQDGIWETVSRRRQGRGLLSLVFQAPSDGSCMTRDGNRQDILELFENVAHPERAGIFLSAAYPGAATPVECEVSVTVMTSPLLKRPVR